MSLYKIKRCVLLRCEKESGVLSLLMIKGCTWSKCKTSNKNLIIGETTSTYEGNKCKRN